MSALPPKADIPQRNCYVRFVPQADYPRKRTFGDASGMSALCQMRTLSAAAGVAQATSFKAAARGGFWDLFSPPRMVTLRNGATKQTPHLQGS